MKRRFSLGSSVGAMLTLAACGALALLLWRFTDGGVQFVWQGSDYELLQPRWLVAFAVSPLFVFAAVRSLADLPVAQRGLGVLFRVLLAGTLSLAAARLARTTEVTRVSTVFLLDVSDNVTDDAIADAREAALAAYAARGDHDVQVVTFAEEARAVPFEEDSLPETLRHTSDHDGGDDNDNADRTTSDVSPICAGSKRNAGYTEFIWSKSNPEK